MNKQTIVFICFTQLSSIFFLGCHKNTEEEKKYDLFPLNVGNEFFYTYKYSYSQSVAFGPFKKSIGNIKWTILKESLENLDIKYLIEEKFNGIEINIIELPTPKNDTLVIKDRIRYFTIIEDIDHTISFQDIATIWGTNTSYWSIRLSRYSIVPQNEIHDWKGTNIGMDYYFYADSGLIKYSFNKGPNNNITYESYKLYNSIILH